MNWLAHLALAPADDFARLGNLMGDFVRGTDLQGLPRGIVAGIEQHRAIDRFTDAHEVFRRSRRRIDGPLRPFAGVLVDVFFDHFLARDWDRHGDGRPLRVFADEVYELLQRHRDLLPESLAGAAVPMRRHDWLAAYAATEGIADVLLRMASRLRRPMPLGDGVHLLRRDYEALGGDFAEFFPAVRAFATDWLQGRDGSPPAAGPHAS